MIINKIQHLKNVIIFDRKTCMMYTIINYDSNIHLYAKFALQIFIFPSVCPKR